MQEHRHRGGQAAGAQEPGGWALGCLLSLKGGAHPMATRQAQGSAAVPGQTDPIHLLPRHLAGFSSRACEQASSPAPEENGASQAHRSQLGQSEGTAWTAAAEVRSRLT